MKISPILQQYINFCEKINLSDYYYIVDAEYRYVAASKSFLNANNDLSMIGKKLKETDSLFKHLAPQYGEFSDRFMRGSLKHYHVITSLKVEETLRFFEVRASKIIENNETLGILGIVNNYRPNHVLVKQLKKFNKNIFINLDELDVETDKLKEIHREILWLLALGNSTKQISLILSTIYEREIPDSTISAIIRRNLYAIFDVNNLPALIEAINTSSLMMAFPTQLWNYYITQ